MVKDHGGFANVCRANKWPEIALDMQRSAQHGSTLQQVGGMGGARTCCVRGWDGATHHGCTLQQVGGVGGARACCVRGWGGATHHGCTLQ